MLSVESLNDMLDGAERLAERRQFRALRNYLESLPGDYVASDETALYLLGFAQYMTGDERSAREVIESALTHYWAHQNTRLGRRLLNLRAIIEIEQGRLTAGESMLNELRSLAADANDQRYVAFATLNLGISAQIRGEIEAAICEYRRAGAAFQRLGDLSGLAGCSHNLGMLLRELGEYVASERNFLHARAYFEAHDDLENLLTTDIERAVLLSLTGEQRMAEKTAYFGQKKAEEIGNERLIAEALRVLGMIDIEGSHFANAAVKLHQALKFAESNDIPFLRAEVCMLLARAERGIGNEIAAKKHLQLAEQLFVGMGAPVRARRLWEGAEL